MYYTRRKNEGGVGALRESDDTNFLKPNGQSRNLNVYGLYTVKYWCVTLHAVAAHNPTIARLV